MYHNSLLPTCPLRSCFMLVVTLDLRLLSSSAVLWVKSLWKPELCILCSVMCECWSLQHVRLLGSRWPERRFLQRLEPTGSSVCWGSGHVLASSNTGSQAAGFYLVFCLQSASEPWRGESWGTSGVLPGPEQTVKHQIALQDFQEYRALHGSTPTWHLCSLLFILSFWLSWIFELVIIISSSSQLPLILPDKHTPRNRPF